jgi:amino acid adenylation domain-containing protein
MSIYQLLQAQFTQHPTAIAIKDAGAEITYRQLNNRVNQLANYLRKQGVKSEVLVGIYAERSIDLSIAILAVLKAGGAYIPLDPAYPKERLASIIAETNLHLILTQDHLAVDPAIAGANLFLLDTQWEQVSSESEELAPAQTTSENLAYVMYTSGSTGKPQGVQITIGQVECYLQALNEVVKIQPNDIYLHSASFSFSSSIRQLLLPLSQGATVVITSKENTSNLRSLLTLIQSEHITIFDTVASVWSYLLVCLADLDLDRESQLVNSQIRLLVFSGGLLTSQLLNQVRSQFLRTPQIINIYGQTETIGVCAYSIPNNFDKSSGYAPVGSAYAHNQLYILTDQMQPVAVAETGELYISGASLARGYLNNSQLNDRKFIPNPFATDRQELLYKTGDLARYLPDGNLEIVGRQDFQVKIRGMRVEIEEIETVLMQHPDVQQAAVVGKEDQSGAQTIIAYLVANTTAINTSDVRSFLSTKLNDYMIPAGFQVLDALPLTPNNKLDRNRLPEPIWDNATAVPARDQLELQLVEIWEKALNIQPIGIDDNFFDLGGHSLIALQLFFQIEKIWGKQLSWGTLFESPTIAKIADLIRQEDISTTWSPLVLLKSSDHNLPLFLIHPLGGTLFCYYDLAKELGTDRPIYGLQSQGIDGKQKPLCLVEDIASYFIRSIQTIQPNGPYLFLGYSFGGTIAFEIARQLTSQGQKIAFLGLLDIKSPTLNRANISLVKWMKFHLSEFQKLTLKEQLKYLKDKISERILTSQIAYKDVVTKQLSSLEIFTPKLFDVLDANLQAMNNYVPQVYAGRATLFWSEYNSIYIDRYPELGWGDLVAGSLDIQHVSGDHDTLMKEPHVQVLAEKLKFTINQSIDEIESSQNQG